jgi:hypothetical protein
MMAYFERFVLDLPADVVDACSHPGPVDDDVAEALLRDDVSAELDRIDPEDLRVELAEYGAWDDEELADHEQNRARIVWIAACDIHENIESDDD